MTDERLSYLLMKNNNKSEQVSDAEKMKNSERTCFAVFIIFATIEIKPVFKRSNVKNRILYSFNIHFL